MRLVVQGFFLTWVALAIMAGIVLGFILVPSVLYVILAVIGVSVAFVFTWALVHHMLLDWKERP